MKQFTFALLVLVPMITASLRADEVIFNNGDRLTGKVLSADGGKLKVKSDVAGEVTVDMKDVKTFSTDEPLQVRLKDDTIVREKITAAPAPAEVAPAATQPAAGTVQVAGRTVPLDEVKRIGGKQAWHGSLVANGSLARGNTHSTDVGFSADAMLRRDDETHDDRFTLGAAYNFGKNRTDGVDTTSADNWFALAKYDRFFTEKWYGYGLIRYDHDRLADLNYRLAPGVGVGYQWVESADFNFSTEAGVSYVYEDYSSDGNEDRVALRLAYHVDKKLNEHVSLFHNLEWLPAFDDPSDYNLNADAGVRAKMTDKLFSELKVVYQRDSTPAPGADKNDTRFLLGVGYQF
jgi:putative salt-induced outer membrane protein YdiY